MRATTIDTRFPGCKRSAKAMTAEPIKKLRRYIVKVTEELLFELADDQTESEVSVNIASAIQSYEPRVEVMDIDVNVLPDQNDMRVSIVFKIVSTEEIVTFTTNLSRLR